MKNVRPDMLAILPKWARDHINADTKDINKYLWNHVHIRNVHESTFCSFASATWFFGPGKKWVVILTEHNGYHVFPWNEDMDINTIPHDVKRPMPKDMK